MRSHKGDPLKKFALLGAMVGLGVGVLVVTRPTHAADHLDAPTIKMAANRMADITDVFAWMSSDGSKVNLAMSVSPVDDGTHAFGPSVQYVWHITSHPGASNAAAFGAAGTEVNVICTFASNTSAQCWVAQGTTAKDYVKGDPSNTQGVSNSAKTMKLFAGRRSDPFFFNLAGFLTAQTLIEDGCSGGSAMARMNCPGVFAGITNAAGCPALPSITTNALAGELAAVQDGAAYPSTLGPCPASQADCFAGLNVMAIVVQVDKSLLLGSSDHLLSVWGSTHAAP